MKIVILTAGFGSRLMPLTRNTPKSLLQLNDGRTLLETQIDNVVESGVIDEIILVIGYRAEQIEAKIKAYEKGNVPIRTVFNPFFDISNNLMSLWFAKELLTDDFLITNGDNIINSEIFGKIVKETSAGIHLTVTNIERFNTDDMKVVIKDNWIARVSKEIPEADAGGESIGLVKVAGPQYRTVFLEALEHLVRNPDNRNRFWLETFNYLHTKAVAVLPFRVERGNWYEFDVHIDLETVHALMSQTNLNLFAQPGSKSSQVPIVKEVAKRKKTPAIAQTPRTSKSDRQ